MCIYIYICTSIPRPSKYTNNGNSSGTMEYIAQFLWAQTKKYPVQSPCVSTYNPIIYTYLYVIVYIFRDIIYPHVIPTYSLDHLVNLRMQQHVHPQVQLWQQPPSMGYSVARCYGDVPWPPRGRPEITHTDNTDGKISPGWWFGTWILFFHILGIIIPTD